MAAACRSEQRGLRRVDRRDRQRVEELVDASIGWAPCATNAGLPTPAPAPDHTPIGHQPRCNVSTAPDHASPEPLSALTTNVTFDSAWTILLRPAAVAALNRPLGAYGLAMHS